MRTGKPKGRNGASTGHRAGSRTASRRSSGTASRPAPRTTRHKKQSASGNKNRRWIASVTTDSTYPPKGLFTKDAPTIARTLASRKVSPKGPTSGLRMLLYFINRAGKGLKPERRAELEKAKALLSERIRSRKKSARETK